MESTLSCNRYGFVDWLPVNARSVHHRVGSDNLFLAPMSPSACGKGGAARLAVQAYIDGTNALDAGRTAEGIRLLRRAIDAEPALDAEEWPEWAERLREGLERAQVHPPPYAEATLDLRGLPADADRRELKGLEPRVIYDVQDLVMLAHEVCLRQPPPVLLAPVYVARAVVDGHARPEPVVVCVCA